MTPGSNHAPPDTASSQRGCAIVGAGPAGLMAAETVAAAGFPVDLYDAMPSVGRKFLLAGKSGLNITHAEAPERFLARYGERAERVRPWLEALAPDALREWVHALGIDTFVGSSGRVFPAGMKAAPLLRAWLARLRRQGVRVHARHRFLGWDDGALRMATPAGDVRVGRSAVVLALGGGSWARLGSDGAWVALLRGRGIPVAPLEPANCGFECAWSAHLRERFAGAPVKSVAARAHPAAPAVRGEFVVSDYGVEGSLVYALSRALREALRRDGRACLELDLLPDLPHSRLRALLAKGRSGRSLANRLRAAGIDGVKAGLVRELAAPEELADEARLAAALKALRLPLRTTRALDEAISSAGGVRFEALDERLMLRAMPGVFCAGEMIDWEAPTGGYLLTACLASGRVAGAGAAAWLSGRHGTPVAQREPTLGDAVDRPDAQQEHAQHPGADADQHDGQRHGDQRHHHRP